MIKSGRPKTKAVGFEQPDLVETVPIAEGWD